MEGKGRYYAGDSEYDLQAGQGFLIEPNIQTFYQADENEPWTYLWIGFNGSSAQAYLRDIGLNSCQLTYRCRHANELKLTVIETLKHNTCGTADLFLLESLLYSFFSILARDMEIIPPARSNKDNIYIRRAIEYIHNNYSNTIHVADIAAYVCIDRSYLYTLFRRSFGISPQDYLANCRISCAGELLTITDLPVSGVALSCGYQDPLVFSKAFKQRMGLTPSQYRKKQRQDVEEHLKSHESRLEKL